jgi:restriction endonuclease S subunit
MADPLFITAYVNSPLGRSYIERHMARAIGQVNISASTMARMPIPCPPLDEQRQLVSSLRAGLVASDILIKRCSEEDAASRAVPAALLRAAFSGQ